MIDSIERGQADHPISDQMKIEISERAQKWFEQEMGISGKKGVRFLGKVYGSSQIHEGFSVGLDVDEPVSPIGKAEYNGILYYVEDADDWFFNGYDLYVGFDEKQREPEYNFIAQNKEDK